MYTTIIAFILSCLCGFMFIPLILRFCREKKLYDLPDNRKIHKTKVPRLGGVCFLPSMLMAFLVTTFTQYYATGVTQLTFSLWSLYFFISLMLIYGVGLIDDIVGLGAKFKFTVQIMAACLLPLSGLYLNNLYGFLGIHEIPYIIGTPLTIFIIVFLCNAINLIDGIDGLSAGLSLISLAGFELCFMRQHMIAYCALIAALMGVLVAFLFFNLFGKEEDGRKVFMGDSGSLTLGFILGFLFIKLTMDNPAVCMFHDDAMMLGLSLVVVPVFDVVRVSLVRMRHHAPIFQADKNHIHHKMMRMGLNQHRALIGILLLAVFYIALNCLVWAMINNVTVTLLVDVAVWVAVQQVINKAIKKNGLSVYLSNSKQHS